MKFLILSLLCLTGCRVFTPVQASTPETVSSIVQTVSVVPSLLLVGFVLSVVAAGLGFSKVGMVSAFACLLGLLLKEAMSVSWMAPVSALLVLSSLLFIIAGILKKNTAIKELILGAQKLKNSVKDGNEILKENQCTDTQKIVQDVKAKLKSSGEM